LNRTALSIRQAVTFAWPTFKKHFVLFAAILLTIAAAWVVLEVVVVAGQRLGLVWWAAAHLAFLVFVAGIEAGWVRVCLALYDGGEPAFADIFGHLALGPWFLAAQLIYLFLVLVGLALLVVPGLYLGTRFALFGFPLATGEADLIRSFQRSALLTTGTRLSLFGALLSLLIFNVLGACLLGIGLFVTLPLSVLILTAVYRQLSPG
jgi:hypothetical protein